MKITERIALLRAGYTKDEISQMIEEDKIVEENVPEDKPSEPAEDYSAVIKALTDEVKSLKASMQQKNINETEVKRPAATDQALEVLASLINPKQEEK